MLRLSAGLRTLSGSEFQVDAPNNSKTLTTKTVQMIARNDQLLLTGRPQMLMTSNVGRWCAAVHQVVDNYRYSTLDHVYNREPLNSAVTSCYRPDVLPAAKQHHQTCEGNLQTSFYLPTAIYDNYCKDI